MSKELFLVSATIVTKTYLCQSKSQTDGPEAPVVDGGEDGGRGMDLEAGVDVLEARTSGPPAAEDVARDSIALLTEELQDQGIGAKVVGLEY